MTAQPVGLQRLGRYAGIAVLASVVVCYATPALTPILSSMGVTMDLHEGAWATVIVVFAWIAVLAVGVNIPVYRSLVPFIIADVGALLVSWVMFIQHSRGLEILGFAMLVVAALRDWYLRRRGPPALDPSEEASNR